MSPPLLIFSADMQAATMAGTACGFKAHSVSRARDHACIHKPLVQGLSHGSPAPDHAHDDMKRGVAFILISAVTGRLLKWGKL